MLEHLRLLRPAWASAGILIAAALCVWLGRALPPTLEGLHTAGPYAALVVAVALAWWFNRGRSFVVAASLLGAFAAMQSFRGELAYLALTLLVPLNVLAAMLRPELGARHGAAIPWLLVFAVEAMLLWWMSGATPPRFVLENVVFRSPPVPLVARLMFAAAAAAAVWRAWPDYAPTQVGNVGALVAFFLGATWFPSQGAWSLFMTAAGLVILVAVLHESHRLAFRDQLTGLPSRRALEERLRTLSGDYAIAMVDVDHFKGFNDKHGHDVGDQVLRLVAGRLAEVEGGGTAYRYGGEEFSVIFPGVRAKEVEAELERLRGSIETYRMAVRGGDRPKQAKEGARRRGQNASRSPVGAPPETGLAVTVSIGVASPSKRRATPQLVVQAADEALYAAKQGGRNRVVVAGRRLA